MGMIGFLQNVDGHIHNFSLRDIEIIDFNGEEFYYSGVSLVHVALN